MRRLAIETATTATAVGLDDGRGHRDEAVVDAQRRHTESLPPAAAALLEARGLSPGDLDEVVVDVGPGLFTGLRVGLAFAKGLALAAGAAVHGVLSTDVLAAAAAAAGADGPIVAVVDARRGEVFAARYEHELGRLHRVLGPEVLAPEALAALLAAAPRATLVGDGARRHAGALGGSGELLGIEVPPPSAALELAAARAAAGEAPEAVDDVRPWYLREADAVANFAVRAPR